MTIALEARRPLPGLLSARQGAPSAQVYEHHCISQLPGPTRRLRDGALFIVNNVEAVQWALELYGFKDVHIKVSH